MLTDVRWMQDVRVIGIPLAHPCAFGSGELKIMKKGIR